LGSETVQTSETFSNSSQTARVFTFFLFRVKTNNGSKSIHFAIKLFQTIVATFFVEFSRYILKNAPVLTCESGKIRPRHSLFSLASKNQANSSALQ